MCGPLRTKTWRRRRAGYRRTSSSTAAIPTASCSGAHPQADLIAGYLAHPQFHGSKGHGIKAAIMFSGFYEKGVPAYFGSDPAEREKRASTERLKKATIPVFVSHTEVDLPESIE